MQIFTYGVIQIMDFYFLLFSLFFPRITMLVYFVQNQFPNNTVPFLGDLLLGVFIPRILILILIYQNMGYENIWFVAHLLVMILTYFGGGTGTKRRFWKRTKD